MRGLKRTDLEELQKKLKSHLLQMRGLKRLNREHHRHKAQSHLLQMRGLKLHDSASSESTGFVASFTDAWIETDLYRNSLDHNIVASFTDAWIETGIGANKRQKRAIVASFTDAWIETERVSCSAVAHLSHLLQMRGLKQPNQFLK